MTETRIRQFLLLLAGGVFAGTPLELWLAEHTEETAQKIPFIICSLGVLAIGFILLRPMPLSIYLLRGVMITAIVASLLGIYFHLTGNFAFELEIRPNATRDEVIMDALKGANPLLAPGILSVAGFIGLIASYQHPAVYRKFTHLEQG